MNVPFYPDRGRNGENIAALAGAAVVALGLFVMFGWHAGRADIVQVLPAFVPMQYNTALAFLLCGGGLVAARYDYRLLTGLCGGAAATMGILAIVQYLSGADFGIDEFFFKHHITVLTPFPGRMALNTALAFTFFGSGLLGLSLKSWTRHHTLAASILGSLTLGFGMVALIGYMVRLDAAHGWGDFSHMALHTATGFAILGSGLITLTLYRARTQKSHLPWLIPLAVAMAVVIFLVDIALPLGVAGGVPYVALVLLGLWSPRRSLIVVLALVATLLTLGGYIISPEGGIPWMVAANRGLALFAIWVTAILCLRHLKSAEKLRTVEQKHIEESLSRISRALKVLSECNHALIGGADEQKLLEKICRIIVEKSDYIFAWVGTAEQDAEKSVRPAAWWGFEDGYLETANITWGDGERGQGPVGAAIRTGIIQISHHIRSDPQFKPWRREALKRGYESDIALPLIVDLQRYGALVIYAPEPDAFSADETRFLETLADNLSFGIQTIRLQTERQQAVEALRKSEQRYQLAVRGSTDGIWDWNIETKEGYHSERWSELLGYEPNELSNKFSTFSDLLHPDDRDRVMGAVQRHLKERVPYEEEMRLRTKSGDYKWFLERGQALWDDEGRATRMSGSISDITQRKQAEEALQLTQFSLDHTHDGFFGIHPDSRLFYVNDAACQSLGYSREELLGMSVSDIDSDATQDFWDEHWSELRQAGSLQLERVHRRKDGTIFPVEISANYHEFMDQEYNFAAARDITERKRAEEALRESEEQFREVFEQAPHGMALVSLDGSYTKANRILCDITGYSEEELLALDIGSLTHSGDRARDEKGTRALLDEKIDSHHMEKRYIRKDGNEIWVNISLVLVRDPRNEPLHFVSQIEDITERRTIEEQLRRSQKMEAIGKIAGGVAHEFNNVLMGILGSLELIEEDVRDNRPVHDKVKTATGEALRGKNLTHQLLAYSRAQPVEARTQDLRDTVESLVRLMRRTLGETITTETKLAEDLWPVVIDPDGIETALLNLAINARDAMPGGGIITIGAENILIDRDATERSPELAEGEYVLVSVSDKGEGMSAGVLERAFDPFFTTKDVGKGTGLGLSMVYGFAHQSDGHVEIESETGQGTTVRLYLPRAGAEEGPALETPTDEGDFPTGCEAVLVAEDDPVVRMITVTMLESLGYSVRAAENGELALASLEEAEHTDLLLTDVIMPEGMSGVDLGQKAQTLHPGLKVIMVTGYSPDELELEKEDWPLLVKPYRKAELAACVRQALDGEA